MPQIKPVRIHSCSPSHEKYPASNLLQAGSKQPWKCRDQGEKRAFVVLELAKPTVINGIDIGNEHSCFIEVLVGNQGDSENDFQQLLLTSSFQTPAESRNSENVNRVRCFSKQAFVESTANKKWGLVKLICTQPFNSRVQYGVSFVTIYSAEEETKKPVEVTKTTSEEPVKKLGLFSLREDSPDSDCDSTSLFSRWKQTKQGNGATSLSPARVTAAAAIRDARNSIGERKSPLLLTPTPASSSARKRPSTDTPIRNRNRENLLYDDEDESEGNEKLEKLIEKDKKRAEEELKTDKKKTKPEKEKKPVDSTPAKKFKFSDNKIDDDRPSHSSASSSKEKEVTQPPRQEKPKKPKKYKPFRKLLEGVVLTISGIQNPERANLRSKALEMGAKYKTDWDDNCTHLICAFRNTPKYNQVQGVGKIVKKDWVLKCHENKRHIPWRRFALDNKEADKSESEDEIYDEAEREKEEDVCEKEKETPITSQSPVPSKNSTAEEEDDDIMMIYDQEQPPVVICDSGSDTEDEIEKVRTESKVKEANEKDVTVDSENSPHKNGDSGGFLSGKKFYLDEDNGAVKIIKCNAIITKYGGEVIESRDACDFWIKSKQPPSEFLNKPSLPVVKPLWLEESADMDCLLPIKRYIH